MDAGFEQLDWSQTSSGRVISLRRRHEPSRDVDVYEAKLDDEFLMSSLFTVAEIELARLGLAEARASDLDVVVGGLGLGYTARAALDDPRVRSLVVVEAVPEVIAWHERGLVPEAAVLTTDERVSLVEADFFALAEGAAGFDPDVPGRRFHAILVDIDHSPRSLLDAGHAGFYTATGLRRLGDHLHDGGVFALWSDDPPDADFQGALTDSFGNCDAHVVTFPNFYTGGEAANTVYVATSRPAIT